jgi:adenosylhomocysteinase
MHLYGQKFAQLPPAQKPERISVEVLPRKLDEEVAAEMVRGFSGVVTKLRPEQARYINVSLDGPYKPESYRY